MTGSENDASINIITALDSEEIDEPSEMGSFEDETSHISRNKKTIPAMSSGLSLSSSLMGTYIQLYAVFVGASAIILSLLISLRNLFQLGFQAPFGRLSDRIGRKPLIFGGFMTAGFISFLVPQFDSPYAILFLLIFYSLSFSAVSPAWQGLLGDNSSIGKRTKYLSKITSIGTFTTFLSLLILGWIMDNVFETAFLQYQFVFVVAGTLFILTGLLSLTLKEKTISIKPQRLARSSKLAILDPLRNDKTFWKFTLISGIMGFAMSIGWPVFPYIREEYATPSENARLWMAFSLTQLFALLVAGRLSARFGLKPLLFFGRFIMFFIPIINFFARTWYELMMANLVGGLGFGIFVVSMNSYILESSSAETKGAYIGSYNLVFGLFTFAGSLLSGLLLDHLASVMGFWDAIYLMCIIIAIARFLGSLPFLFIDEPKGVKQ
ncbi:MAG: MFS transporter [Candidatus Heimdallarchaeota archaeon]|nr:MFS transporter [Candidatus Heimdallarchaeota archaeon]MCK5048092.1 MFS transporter [Candidatus Heimdallarchaeota archaeon]